MQQISTSKEKGSESGSGTNSTFKLLKKKIRNKFRLSKSNVKSLSEASEILKRSNEILETGGTNNPETVSQLHSEFSSTQ